MTSDFRSGSLTASTWPIATTDPSPIAHMSTAPLRRPGRNPRIALGRLDRPAQSLTQRRLGSPKLVACGLRDVETRAVKLDAARALGRVPDLRRRARRLREGGDQSVDARPDAGADVVDAGPATREGRPAGPDGADAARRIPLDRRCA